MAYLLIAHFAIGIVYSAYLSAETWVDVPRKDFGAAAIASILIAVFWELAMLHRTGERIQHYVQNKRK